MSLLLPPEGHEARYMFDMIDLANKNFTTLAQAKLSAIKTFRTAAPNSIKSVQFLVIRHDDTIQLISIGPRGGRRVEWTFGKINS